MAEDEKDTITAERLAELKAVISKIPGADKGKATLEIYDASSGRLRQVIDLRTGKPLKRGQNGGR